MKQTIKNLFAITLILTLFAQVSLAQMSLDKVNTFNEEITTSIDNTLEPVMNQITKYLDTNLNLSEELLSYLNEDINILVAVTISETGKIENVKLMNKESKAFGKQVVKELYQLGSVLPVFENGVAVSKVLNVPIVFKKS